MMVYPNRGAVLSLGLLFALIRTPSAEAQDATGWAVYGGIYDTAAEEQPVELGVEYRWPTLELGNLLPARLALEPAAGAAGTEDGNFWVYGGLRLDLELGGGWVVTPQFSVALYEKGDGKDLGGVLEFRSGLEVAHRFAGGQRLGVLFYHLSNADFYDLNPGSNSLVLTWGFGR